MNNSKIKEYKVIEVKPGVYLGDAGNGLVQLTDDINKAIVYEFDDYKNTKEVADYWFGEVKTIKVITEVE